MRFAREMRLLWVCLCWVGLLSISAQANSRNRISHVGFVKQGDGVVVEIVGERAPNFTTFKQDSPKRVIVDVAECQLNGVPAWSQGSGLVKGITVRQIGKAPDSVVRVMISLSTEAEYRVTIREGSLFVHLIPGTGGLLVSAGVPLGPRKVVSGKARQDNRLDHGKLEHETNLVAESASLSDMGAHDQALEEGLSSSSLQRRVTGDQEISKSPHPVRLSTASSGKPDKPRSLPPVADSGSLVLPQTTPDPDKEEEPDEVPRSIEPRLIARASPGRDVQPTEPPLDTVKDDDGAVEDEEEVGATEEAETEEVLSVDTDEVPSPSSLETPTRAEVAPSPDLVEEPSLQVEERVEMSSTLRHMTWVGFRQTSESSRVFVKTNAPVSYRVNEEGQSLVVLELDNTVIPLRNNRRFLDTHFFDSAVAMIVPREVGGVGQSVRIEIQLKQRVPFRAGREENMVFVNFERTK